MLNEDNIVDIWTGLKEFIDKKVVETAASKYIDVLADMCSKHRWATTKTSMLPSSTTSTVGTVKMKKKPTTTAATGMKTRTKWVGTPRYLKTSVPYLRR